MARRTPPPEPPKPRAVDLADAIMIDAWLPGGEQRLLATLTLLTGDRQRARFALMKWHRLPLSLDRPTPTHLPTGEELPAPAAPFGRHLSPLPGVDLPADEVVDLALSALERASYGSIDRNHDDLVEKLVALVGRAQIASIGGRLLVAWVQKGHALACVRAAHARPRPGWFDEHEIEAFLSLAAERWPTRSHNLPDPMFRELLRLGFEPHEAKGGLQNWTPNQATLPGGQWVPAELRRKADQGTVVSAGVEIPPLVIDTVQVHLAQGNKIMAIKEVRAATGVGLREAKEAVESLEVVLASRGRSLPQGRRTEGPRSAARRWLDRVIDRLIVCKPMHWVLLAGARICESARARTMAVGLSRSGQLTLFYCPDFVTSLREPQLLAVLQHEINHVILRHLRHAPEIDKPGCPGEKVTDERAWVVACEVTANEFVSFPLPGNPITLELLGMAPLASTEARYQQLAGRGDLPELMADCAADLLDDEASEPGQLARSHLNADALSVHLLRGAAELAGAELDASTASMLGSVGLDALVAEVLPSNVSELPWHVLLRRLAGGRGQRQSTLKYPSRRAPDRIGVVPGVRRRREDPVVLVAIDTSGSMWGAELAQVEGELRALVRRSVRVHCVQCDDQIRDRRWVSPSDPLPRVIGGGGTDLRPPFSPSLLAELRPSLIVYFTDGYGVAPPEAPVGAPVLWVLTGASPAIPARFGTVVCMRPPSQRSRLTAPASAA